jgi:RNA polymerase II subunit A C-terminal domain phosphatase
MERATASIRLPLRVLADPAGRWTLRWLVRQGDTVYRNQRVAALHSAATGAVDHALAPHGGTLVQTLVPEGSSVSESSQPHLTHVIAQIEYCPHSVVFSGLCAVCGEEATAVHFADAPVAEASARLPVAYNAKTLSVTRAEAQSIASATAQQLLQTRRLSLVLDLDHTLVHATDDPRAAAVLDHTPPGIDTSSIAAFTLEPCGGVQLPPSWMHVKLRPHLSEFLSRCSKLFELHIYTMGSRPYADRIADLIDPDKRLFSGRITSREDFDEGRSNQKNISRLFPCDDSMVLIIDDREDVWVSGTGVSFMPNLIRAKPYTFWNGLHEAYDRALATGNDFNAAGTDVVTDSCAAPAPVSPSNLPADRIVLRSRHAGPDMTVTVVRPTRGANLIEMKSRASAPPGEESSGDSDPSIAATSKETNEKFVKAADKSASPADFVHGLDGVGFCNTFKIDSQSGWQEGPMPDLSTELHSLVVQWWKSDVSVERGSTHLRKLADVLEDCHAQFFSKTPMAATVYNGTRDSSTLNIPADVKAILAGIRTRVLAGCVLTFTGVFPLNVRPEESPLWSLAVRHGAMCTRDFELGHTTHVIASPERGSNTDKARSAVESGTAFCVDVSWVEDSTIHFEARPELMYSFHAPVPASSWQEFRANVSVAYNEAKNVRLESAATANAVAAALFQQKLDVDKGRGVRIRCRSPTPSCVQRPGPNSPSPKRQRKTPLDVSRSKSSTNDNITGVSVSGKKPVVLVGDEIDDALDDAFDGH